MTSPPSVTSSDSFQFRAQRSEQQRIVVMIGVLLFLALIVVARRAIRGAVMSDNKVFYSTLIVICVVLAHELVMLALIWRANRQNRLLPEFRWWVNASVELAGPLALLAILRFFSPLGEFSALSTPGILVLPLVIMLSILRLRPKFTLWTGLIAGLVHMVLTMHAVFTLTPDAHMYPVLFSYSILLMATGVAGAIAAGQVKRYVREAVAEATAAESARQRVDIMQRDLSIARDIQRGLLPTTPPSLEGFDIAGFSRPADETGGDYYDWQTLPDGRVAVALADVTGHGIGPALVMAVCRAYARASAPITPEPHVLLARLNDLIHADVGGNRFITFALALVDGKNSRIELLSAGHGPILLYRAAQNSVEHFRADGYPLGIVAEGEYSHAHTLNLSKGDALLLVTDGFFEWQRPSDKQAFGIERIEEVFKQNAGEQSQAILKRIDDAARAFCAGAVQNDDMTAVVVKRR